MSSYGRASSADAVNAYEIDVSKKMSRRKAREGTGCGSRTLTKSNVTVSLSVILLIWCT